MYSHNSRSHISRGHDADIGGSHPTFPRDYRERTTFNVVDSVNYLRRRNLAVIVRATLVEEKKWRPKGDVVRVAHKRISASLTSSTSLPDLLCRLSLFCTFPLFSTLSVSSAPSQVRS